MDRLAYLISKLNEQFSENVSHDYLLATIKEIEQLIVDRKLNTAKPPTPSRVAVVMPASSSQRSPSVQDSGAHSQKPIVREIPHAPLEEPIPRQQVSGKPAHQDGKELNEVMATLNTSVNDLLKKEVVEVGHLLTDSPIRDLRRAIGVNDRYVFVNELFMGDEETFDETIKTINAFRIHGEAIFWIEKEVAKPLAWNMAHAPVQQFLQLVRRRFL